jgi:hypothetical protein
MEDDEVREEHTLLAWRCLESVKQLSMIRSVAESEANLVQDESQQVPNTMQDDEELPQNYLSSSVTDFDQNNEDSDEEDESDFIEYTDTEHPDLQKLKDSGAYYAVEHWMDHAMAAGDDFAEPLVQQLPSLGPSKLLQDWYHFFTIEGETFALIENDLDETKEDQGSEDADGASDEPDDNDGSIPDSDDDRSDTEAVNDGVPTDAHQDTDQLHEDYARIPADGQLVDQLSWVHVAAAFGYDHLVTALGHRSNKDYINSTALGYSPV